MAYFYDLLKTMATLNFNVSPTFVVIKSSNTVRRTYWVVNILVSYMFKIRWWIWNSRKNYSLKKIPGPWGYINSAQTYVFYLCVFNSISYARVTQNLVILRFTLKTILYLFSYKQVTINYFHNLSTRQSLSAYSFGSTQCVQFKHP